MSQPRQLLCPVDFSGASLEAARYAAGLCADLGGRLKLLYVYHTPLLVTSVAAPRHFADLSPEQLLQLEEALATLKRELAGLRGVAVETALAVGAPAERIVEAAKATPTDMIIIGSVGRSRIRHLFLGSVAERVLRMSPVPVLVLPAA